MKIVQLITEIGEGGAEKILFSIAAHLQATGHSVTVISLKPLPPPGNKIIESLKAASVTDIRSLNMTRLDVQRLFLLRRELLELKPPLVHSHLFHANVFARLACVFSGIKVVNSIHIAERRMDRFWHFVIDRLTFFLCDVSTAVSVAARNFHAARTLIPQDSIKVVYNGISLPEKLSGTEIDALRKDWGMESCSKLIGSTGRLEPQKGYDILLKMLLALSAKVPQGEKWGLLIVGEGSERAHLEKLAADAPENIIVKLPGYRADAARIPGAFDLFIMPSRYEGFGLVLAEAMSHGVPALVNAIDSLPELIVEYPQGRATDFEHASHEAVAEQIYYLLYEEKCRTPYTGKFLESDMINEYMNIYRSLLPEFRNGDRIS